MTMRKRFEILRIRAEDDFRLIACETQSSLLE